MASLSSSASSWTPSTDAQEWSPGSAPVTLPSTPSTPTFIALDVECVATSKSCRGRAVGLIAAVNFNEETIFFEYVKPDVPVASPMTLLTGITRKDLESARPLSEVMVDFRKLLGDQCTLIGHGIKSDLEWLGLTKGVDYVNTQDTAKLFAVKTPENMITPSLRHLSLSVFGVDMQTGVHSPSVDALYALKLYKMHLGIQHDPAQLNHVHQVLLATPKPPPVAKRYPYIDGCELSSRSSKYAAELALRHPSHVIFLDIDGVLNRTRKANEIHLEQTMVDMLKEGIQEIPHPIGIVLSTFWRSFSDYCVYVLRRKGLTNVVYCGTTECGETAAAAAGEGESESGGDGGGGGGGGGEEKKMGEEGGSSQENKKSRCDEIAEYLFQHPEISHFCILDDRESASNKAMSSHFVMIEDSKIGLTKENVVSMKSALEISRHRM